MTDLAALFLVESERGPSARTRAHDLVLPLGERGIAARVLPLGRGAERARAFEEAASTDVVVLQRKLLPGRDLARLRRAARALVFDLDDALGERPADVRARGPSGTRRRRFADALRCADLVTTGSAHLRDVVRAQSPARVRVLPVAVELPPEVNVRRSDGDGRTGTPVVLVWTGARATLPYLERARPALAALARRRPCVRLDVVADVAPGELGVPARAIAWSLDAERRALAEADVGLMPLDQDPWSLGKCGLKLALYQAHGLPAVASRWGGGAEVIDPGVTGLLADSEGEWLEALERLVGDPQRRRAMGVRARGNAAARLSLGARATSWAGVLREAASRRREGLR